MEENIFLDLVISHLRTRDLELTTKRLHIGSRRGDSNTMYLQGRGGERSQNRSDKGKYR